MLILQICITKCSIYIVYGFGVLTDEGQNFRSLTGNTLMYNSTTLACKGDVNSGAITWQYSVNSDLSSSSANCYLYEYTDWSELVSS